jgi:hypothetical protein
MVPHFLFFRERYVGGADADRWLAERLGRTRLGAEPGWASVEFDTSAGCVVNEGPEADRNWPELIGRYGPDLAGSKGLELAERGLTLGVAFAGAPAGSPVLVLREGPAERDKKGAGPGAAWVVLEARPESRNYCGRRRGLSEAEFVAQFRRWPGVEALEDHRAEPGQTVVAPARLPHALGKGVLAYYVAVKAAGDPGAVMANRAQDPLTVAAPAERMFVQGIGYIEGMNAVTWLCAQAMSATVRLDLRAPRAETMRPGSSFIVLTTLRGTGLITSGDETETLSPARTVIVSAACPSFRLSPGPEGLSILKTWVPDHAHDIEAPLLAQGVTRREVEGLYGFFGRL